MYKKPVLIDLRQDSLMFNLNKNLSYFIILHEPDFFLVTFNPVTMPTTDTTLSYQEIHDSYMTLTLQVKIRGRWTYNYFWKLCETVHFFASNS